MNKEQQIEEMAKKMQKYYEKNGLLNFKWFAEALYNAGYRKLPEDSVVLSREEHEILVKTAQGKIGNMKATDLLKACISSGFMVEAVSTKEQVKQAVKEFAEKLKANSVETKSPEWGFMDFVDVNEIDELLKEYEQ